MTKRKPDPTPGTGRVGRGAVFGGGATPDVAPDPRDRRTVTNPQPPPEPPAGPPELDAGAPPPVDEALKQNMDRYLNARRVMQAAVTLTLPHTTEGEPAALRLGVNVALSQVAALIDLLLARGVITSTETWQLLADTMERDAQAWQTRLNTLLDSL